MIDQTINGIPVIDLKHYLEDEKILRREAAQAVFRSLLTYSAVIVKDPRISPEDFSGCQDLLRKYFNQPRSALLPDVHPEFHHQVGLSLEYAEGWRHSLLERAAGLPAEHQPHIPPSNYSGDPKLRFFIRLGEARALTADDPLNQPPVIPRAFEHCWHSVTNSWGQKLLTTGGTVLKMLEEVLGLEPGTLQNMTVGAPHLLGPNAANLDALNVPGTIINAYHYDLNALTIHGPANYPGLRIWLRDNTSLSVKMPPGHILIQVGQQLEWITGGLLTAGMHEVVVTQEGLDARQKSDNPWRISSPCFMHFASEHTLNILPEARAQLKLTDQEWAERLRHYPPILVREQVERELYEIGLAR
jgi:isopenicillin N synthase-like dioxygenase